jgi:transposase
MQPDMQNQSDFAAFVAIDWADQKHVWTLKVVGTPGREHGHLDHTPESIDAWAAALAQRFPGQPIAVALEQSRGPLVFMLTKYEHLVIFPVHPTTLANFRRSFRPSGAKDDPDDAGLLLDVLTLHRDKLRRLDPDTPETRMLQFLVEERRKFVDDKTRYSNRLTAHLKMYFPQALGWFDVVGSPMFADFLLRWPVLEKLQKARPATIKRFFIEHNSRNPERIEQRLEQMRKAVAATHDQAVVTSSSTAVLSLASLLKQLLQVIGSYDEQIDRLARRHPDYALIKSFPGAGPALAPRLIAAIGSQRKRYGSAHELQCYSGIAPVVCSSGKQRVVHCRWAFPVFLRQTFHEWALHSIAQSKWARAYYDERKDRGKSHHSAIRALAFKWMRILFRCWKDNQPYDEQKYLRAVAERRPAKIAAPAVECQWKTVAGFSKLTTSGA